MALNFIKSKVLENTKLNYKFHRIRFELSEEADFIFKPGQFVVVKVSDGIFRSYSVASLPEQLPTWEIFIDITPDGPGCRFLKNLKKGAVIETTTPRGIFTLGDANVKHHILTATGCGLASILPMTETVLNRKDGSRVHLLWGLRFEKDIVPIQQEILDRWTKQYPNFSYDIVLSKPEGKWDGKTGHTTNYIVDLVKTLSPDLASVYLCGNQGLVTDVKEALQNIDFPEERLYFERYY